MNIKTAQRVLGNLDKEELIEIVSRITSHNKKADGILLELLAQKNFVDGADVVAQKQARHYWETARKIINKANKKGGTNLQRLDKVRDALNKLADLTSNYEFSWKIKRPVVNEMLTLYFKGERDRRRFYRSELFDACEGLCRTKEEILFFAERLGQSSNSDDKKRASEIYLEYGEESAAQDCLKESLTGVSRCNGDDDHGVSGQLASAFSADVVDLYWRECEKLCDKGDRRDYPRVGSFLEEIRSICEERSTLDQWNERFQFFLERHKRKKLLTGLIDEKGLR